MSQISNRQSRMYANRQDESRKFHKFMGAFVALLITADLLLSKVAHYSGAAETIIISIPLVLGIVIVVVLPFVVICYEWCRSWYRTSLDLSSTALWSLAVWILIGPLLQIAARSHAPLFDAALARIDGQLIQTVVVVRWFQNHPTLSVVSQIAYDSLWSLAIAALFLPTLCGYARDVRHYLLATSISILLTVGLFSLWPAVGPWTTEALTPGKMQAAIGSYLSAIKTHTFTNGPELTRIVAFPSFHTVLAVLSARALWGIRKLRVLVAGLCVAICVSTVATGWHYVIDVFAGIVVAGVSQLLAIWLLQTQPVAVFRVLGRSRALPRDKGSDNPLGICCRESPCRAAF